MGASAEYFEAGLCMVPARTQAIVRWLLDRADQIDQAGRIKITFNCRGDSIVPIAQEFWDTQTVDVDN